MELRLWNACVKTVFVFSAASTRMHEERYCCSDHGICNDLQTDTCCKCDSKVVTRARELHGELGSSAASGARRPRIAFIDSTELRSIPSKLVGS